MKNEYQISTVTDLTSLLPLLPKDSFVHLAAGTYRCKTKLLSNGLTIEGEGADKTVLVYDDYALKKDADGQELVTFRTYTCAVCADDVTLRDLSIVNDALTPETKGQEVALSIYGDRFLMERCRLASTQDTLFVGPLPPDLIERYDGFLADDLRQNRPLTQSFRNCLIEGTVDFIFGCGNALFENCELRSLKDARNCGYIAAPAHSLSQDNGFLFRNCHITASESVEDGSVFLARPWRDYGKVIFENCKIGPHISPLGFDKWNDTDRDKTARFFETPAVSGRVPWVCNPDESVHE